MLATAIADEPRFEMDPCEIEREGPSFTIDTVQLFRDRYPGAKLYYFIGDDNLPELDTWRDIANLRESAHFGALPRRHAVLVRISNYHEAHRDFLYRDSQSHCPRTFGALHGAPARLRRDRKARALSR